MAKFIKRKVRQRGAATTNTLIPTKTRAKAPINLLPVIYFPLFVFSLIVITHFGLWKEKFLFKAKPWRFYAPASFPATFESTKGLNVEQFF